MTSPSGAYGRSEKQGGPKRRRRPLLRAAAWTFGGLFVLAGALFVGGFVAFTFTIASREPVAPKRADAIVVLTGGASRVADGVQLLAEGRGQRLLISGVNRATSADELRRTLPAGEAFLDCCVDLGKKALNTWGNAIEAAEWVRSRRFRSLVVVTSAYHMPRALFELGRALPDVELIAYPVVTDRMQDSDWWTEPQTAKLLLKEYVKYMMAQAKIRPLQAVAPVAPAEDPARGAGPKPSPGPQAAAH